MSDEIRSRVRAPQAQSSPPQQERPSLLKTGAQAEAARVAEAERQTANQNLTWQPRRFWVPYQGDENNRTKEFIILDSEYEKCPRFYEHNLPDPQQGGKRLDFQMCIKEIDNCPLCEKDGDSYYVQMISVIESLPESKFFQNNKTGETVKHLKRLLPVKSRQQPFFENLCKDTFQGNMRGAHILTTREPDMKSAAIGVPRLAIDNQTQQVLRYSEQILINEYGHAPVHSQQGKLIKEANADIYPYDYQKLFVTPSADELRRKYGGVIPAGSTAEIEKVWGGSSGGQMQEQAPSTGDGGSATSPGIQRQTAASPNNGSEDYLNDPSDEIPF